MLTRTYTEPRLKSTYEHLANAEAFNPNVTASRIACYLCIVNQHLYTHRLLYVQSTRYVLLLSRQQGCRSLDCKCDSSELDTCPVTLNCEECAVYINHNETVQCMLYDKHCFTIRHDDTVHRRLELPCYCTNLGLNIILSGSKIIQSHVREIDLNILLDL